MKGSTEGYSVEIIDRDGNFQYLPLEFQISFILFDINQARFEVLKAMAIIMTLFSDIMRCNLLYRLQFFGSTCCLHLYCMFYTKTEESVIFIFSACSP
jgi:hypothetical protein